jgi:hypothetical protein
LTGSIVTPYGGSARIRRVRGRERAADTPCARKPNARTCIHGVVCNQTHTAGLGIRRVRGRERCSGSTPCTRTKPRSTHARTHSHGVVCNQHYTRTRLARSHSTEVRGRGDATETSCTQTEVDAHIHMGWQCNTHLHTAGSLTFDGAWSLTMQATPCTRTKPGSTHAHTTFTRGCMQ